MRLNLIWILCEISKHEKRKSLVLLNHVNRFFFFQTTCILLINPYFGLLVFIFCLTFGLVLFC